MYNKIEKFCWLSGLIHAHKDHTLCGRTRLQKEMWLLQRKGMPSGYDFRIHHYGIYSEGIQSNINLIERFGYVTEEPIMNSEGNTYSTFHATKHAELPEMEAYRLYINRMEEEEDAVILELAATYDAYRHAGLTHIQALYELKRKKADKCSECNLEKSFTLLRDLELDCGD